MSAPRLLPLIAVAIGGVVAIKALSGVEDLPRLLAPTAASAEEAPRSAKRPQVKAAAAPPQPQAAQSRPPPRPPVCAPGLSELAREANLSPSELQTLQSLQARRGQLDQRERDLDTQLHLLSAAELKLDAKLQALAALKAQVQGLIGAADQRDQAELDRLVRVYEKMKPRDAAAVMAQLDDRVRVPVAAKMKDAALAAILQQMAPADAKRLTESLARRFAPAQVAALTPPADKPAPAASAPTDATVGVIDPRRPARRPHRSPAAKPKTAAATPPAPDKPATA